MVRTLSVVSTACLALAVMLALRRGFLTARELAGAARSFVTGDVQHARIAEVGEPQGFFTPSSNRVLYRLSRRFRLPIVGRKPLTEMMAFELRREGLDIDLDWRPPPGVEIIDGPAEAT